MPRATAKKPPKPVVIRPGQTMRKCNICPTEEPMDKFQRFCKRCKSSGKADAPHTYLVHW